MPLPPLSDRETIILQEQRKKLEHTYDECAKIFGALISPNAVRALDRINDAMDAIDKELSARGKPRPWVVS